MPLVASIGRPVVGSVFVVIGLLMLAFNRRVTDGLVAGQRETVGTLLGSRRQANDQLHCAGGGRWAALARVSVGVLKDALGCPRVVFFPGASGASAFWVPVADRMPDGWQTRLLSWSGAGTEPHDPEIKGYDDLLDRAATAVRDGSDVVAQSMGAVVAIGLALSHPGRRWAGGADKAGRGR